MSKGGAEAVGYFVEFDGSPGLGRISAFNGDGTYTIDFFESPAEPVAESRRRTAKEFKRARLQVQTRVFFRDGNSLWRAGRIVGGGPDVYAVRLPNSELDVPIAESRLRVRWDRPPRDPLQVLLSNAQESPHFRNARIPVRDLLLQDRASCGSMEGIMSSGVQLHSHQVAAAARVLTDPVQRYLLADEVGMGKTIQAGFVMRQLLLDSDRAEATVIAPESIRSQWVQELTEKFHLDQFPGPARFKVLSHTDPAAWKDRIDSDLVVVDEAQLLGNVSSPLEEPYRTLADLVHHVPRLLLLSATPSLQTDTTHLALLHLLDPTLYSWGELDAFRRLLAIRRDLAMAVFGLDEDPDLDNPEFVEMQLDDIRASLPEDEQLNELSNSIVEILRSEVASKESRQVELARRIKSLRAHVSETYRLHHRVIRNRRHTALNAPLDDEGLLSAFKVTGRGRPRLIALESAENLVVEDAVQRWLNGCQAYLVDTSEPPETFASTAALILSRAGCSVDDLADLLRWRVRGQGQSEVAPEEQSAIAAPAMPFEEELLSALEGYAGEDGIEEIGDKLQPRLRNVRRSVVFCGPGALAGKVAKRLRHAMEADVYLLDNTTDARASRDVQEAWEGRGGVLVCDESGDVGLNLQSADVAVHLRLPWDPNRLEQRLGRVDRYGEGRTAVQMVAAAADSATPTRSWLTLLIQGFGVFSTSISALHDPVDRLLPELWTDVARLGMDVLAERVDQIRSELALEARRVNEMDQLESGFELSQAFQSGDRLTRRIAAFDSRARSWEKAFTGLVTGVEGFRLQARDSDGVWTFEAASADPLITPRLLANLVVSGRTYLTGTFDRWTLRRAPNVPLLRRGNPFVDGIERILELDDRGQACAWWRVDRRWQRDPLAYFGFDILVEADDGPALELVSVDAVPAVRRRADTALPPFLRRIWIPSDLDAAVDSAIDLAVLESPYRPPRDTNLNASRIGALHNLFGSRQAFAQRAEECAAVARQELERVTDMATLCGSAARAIADQLAVLKAQAEARRAAGSLVINDGVLELDQRLAESLIEGVSSPRIRPVAVACVVRSSRGLPE